MNEENRISYPFRLRKDKTVQLYLPVDLTLNEAKRLGKFIETLVITKERSQNKEVEK